MVSLMGKPSQPVSQVRRKAGLGFTAAAHQASLSFTVSKSLLKLMSTLLLSHRSHHGSHALSWEGPVPVGSALLPQRPHLAEAHF